MIILSKKERAQDKIWQEEADARALARANEIRQDKKRLSGAKKGAKRIVAEEEKDLRLQEKRLRGIKNLAGQAKPDKKEKSIPKPKQKKKVSKIKSKAVKKGKK